MAYYNRSNTAASSIMETFSLYPLPYPVLLIFAVIGLFVGLQWYSSYEEVVEATEQSMGWVLFVIPVVLLITARWLSSMENTDWRIFGMSPYQRHRHANYLPSEGSSPWGVAAVILLLLILVRYQSSFLEGWFV